MHADMIKKYAEWINKASDHAIIDDRLLLLRGDAGEILKNTSCTVDAVITDPPYDFDAAGGKLFGRDESHFDGVRDADITDGFNPEILRAVAAADSMLVFMHNDQLYNMIGLLTEPYNQEIGFDPDNGNCYLESRDPLYSRFVLGAWHKDNPVPVANKHYVPDTEIYIHAWRKPFFPQGELSDKGRWITAPTSRSVYNHPTVKPQKIMRKCVRNASLPGSVVFDPFCGSGSTGVACAREGRLFVGIEINPEFYEIAKERIVTAAGTPIIKQGGLFNE